MTSRRRLWLLVAVAGIGYCSYLRIRRPDEDDIDFQRAEEAGTVAALREYLADRPHGDHAGGARKLVAKRFASVRQAIDAKPGDHAAMDALLDAVLAGGAAPIAVRLAPPNAQNLADVDRAMQAEATEEHPIAPIGPSFVDAKMAWRLADALDEELAKALGADVLHFDEDAPDGGVTLRVSWSVHGSDKRFGSPTGKRVFVGIACDFQAVLELPDGKPVLTEKFVVEPAERFEYLSDSLGAGFAAMHPEWDSEDASVYGGMAESAFHRFGIELHGRLAGATPPAPAVTSPIERTRRWCEDDHNDEACVDLAKALLAGDDVPRDPARAATLLHDACIGFDAPAACPLAARLFAEGDGDAVPRDLDKARQALRFGCEHHEATSCFLLGATELGDAIGEPYRDGPKDTSTAAAQEARLTVLEACDLGLAAACLRAARLFGDGVGPGDAAEPAAGVVLARRACDGGDADACAEADRRARAAGRRHAAPYGLPLPADAMVFDVRWATLFEMSPSAVIWVATPRSRDAVYAYLDTPAVAPHAAKVSIMFYAADDAERPTTAAPPAGTAVVFSVTPASTTPPCPPCKKGLPPPAFCDCL